MKSDSRIGVQSGGEVAAAVVVAAAAIDVGCGEKENEKGAAPSSSSGTEAEGQKEPCWGGEKRTGRVGEGNGGDGCEGGTPLSAPLLLHACSTAVGAGQLAKLQEEVEKSESSTFHSSSSSIFRVRRFVFVVWCSLAVDGNGHNG